MTKKIGDVPKSAAPIKAAKAEAKKKPAARAKAFGKQPATGKQAFPRTTWQDGGKLSKEIEKSQQATARHPKIVHSKPGSGTQPLPGHKPPIQMRYGLPTPAPKPPIQMRYGLPTPTPKPPIQMRYGLPSPNPNKPPIAMKYGLPRPNPDKPPIQMKYGLPRPNPDTSTKKS